MQNKNKQTNRITELELRVDVAKKGVTINLDTIKSSFYCFVAVIDQIANYDASYDASYYAHRFVMASQPFRGNVCNAIIRLRKSFGS